MAKTMDELNKRDQAVHLTQQEIHAYQNMTATNLGEIFDHISDCGECEAKIWETQRLRNMMTRLWLKTEAVALARSIHISREQAIAYADAELDREEVLLFESHAEDCEQCGALLQEVQAQQLPAEVSVMEGMKKHVGIALRTLTDSIRQGLTWQGSLGHVSTSRFQLQPATMARQSRVVRREEIPLPDEMKPLFLVPAAVLNLQEPGDDDEAATLEFYMPRFSDREMHKNQSGLFEVTIIRRDAQGHEKGRVVGEGRAGKRWNLGNLHDYSEDQVEQWEALLGWQPVMVEEAD